MSCSAWPNRVRKLRQRGHGIRPNGGRPPPDRNRGKTSGDAYGSDGYLVGRSKGGRPGATGPGYSRTSSPGSDAHFCAKLEIFTIGANNRGVRRKGKSQPCGRPRASLGTPRTIRVTRTVRAGRPDGGPQRGGLFRNVLLSELSGESAGKRFHGNDSHRQAVADAGQPERQ